MWKSIKNVLAFLRRHLWASIPFFLSICLLIGVFVSHGLADRAFALLGAGYFSLMGFGIICMTDDSYAPRGLRNVLEISPESWSFTRSKLIPVIQAIVAFPLAIFGIFIVILTLRDNGWDYLLESPWNIVLLSILGLGGILMLVHSLCAATTGKKPTIFYSPEKIVAYSATGLYKFEIDNPHNGEVTVYTRFWGADYSEMQLMSLRLKKVNTLTGKISGITRRTLLSHVNMTRIKLLGLNKKQLAQVGEGLQSTDSSAQPLGSSTMGTGNE